MSVPSSTDREHRFADELRLLAPELADAFDAALAELVRNAVVDADGQLAELLSTGEGASAEVVALAPRRRMGRRVALAGGATVVALAATTGLAAAAVLPAPVQHAVADAAARVGIELPRPAPRDVVVTSRPAPPPPATMPAPPTAAVDPIVVTLPSTAPTPPPMPPSAPAPPAPVVPPMPASDPPVTTVPAAPPPAPAPPTPAPPTTAPPVASPRPTQPPAMERFREAVVAYLTCLREGQGRPEQQRACVRPDPRDFGFPAWPWNVPSPGRSDTAQPPPSSSPPASRNPPAPPPGVAVTPPTSPSSTSVPDREAAPPSTVT